MQLMLAQCIVRFVFEGSRNPRAFVPLLSRSAEGLNEIDNYKVLSTCK